MSDMLRTFIGIPIPPTEALEAVLRDLLRWRRDVRPTRPESLHLTLKFLGETRAAQVSDVLAVLREATADSSPRDVSIGGLGVFPSFRRPTVLWAGVQPADELQRLAGVLEQRLAPLGFAPEARPYRAHMTLARLKGIPPAGFQEFVRSGGQADFGRVTLRRVELLQSTLTPQGSRYTALGSALLGGRGD
jgi:RNA 2',3'-cyclic 3'-phosphodiesterase